MERVIVQGKKDRKYWKMDKKENGACKGSEKKYKTKAKRKNEKEQ